LIQDAEMNEFQSKSASLGAASPLAFRSIALALVAGLTLSACGGGGSAASDTPVPTPTPIATEVAQATKTRALPGFDVQVTPYVLSTAPTTVTRVEVKVSDATAVTALEATLGKDFDTGTAAVATLTAPGVWGIAVPATLAANSGVQLSFTLKNGDGFESGVTDFMVR